MFLIKRRCLSTEVKRRLVQSGPGLEAFMSESIAVSSTEHTRLPPWLKTKIPTGSAFTELKENLRSLKLATVCEEARCPNIGECWNGGEDHVATATIMLMGDQCTRACRFCSVKTSRTPPPLNPDEPEHVANAISKWGLEYVVLTTVDRDDLEDSGAEHMAKTIELLREKAPKTLIEVLTGDFKGDIDAIKRVATSGLHVFAHNLETVEELTEGVRDRKASYRQSLKVLESAKTINSSLYTKSSLMLGLGETDEQIRRTLADLRLVGVDFLTMGQYMRPSKGHLKVHTYVHPDVFAVWQRRATEEFGFKYAACGPLIRSSYRAGEFFIKSIVNNKND